MPTFLLLAAHLALHAAFLWGMQTVFRKQAPTPWGVRLIVVASAASIAAGAGAISMRAAPGVMLDLLALACSAAAAGLFVAGVRTVGRQHLRAAFSTAGPDTLISRGPYRWLRNPFYTAYLLGHTMPLLASGSAWALPGPLLMAVIYHAAVRAEERAFLAGPLAPAWRRYAQRTGRFLPRPAAVWQALFPPPERSSR